MAMLVSHKIFFSSSYQSSTFPLTSVFLLMWMSGTIMQFASALAALCYSPQKSNQLFSFNTKKDHKLLLLLLLLSKLFFVFTLYHLCCQYSTSICFPPVQSESGNLRKLICECVSQGKKFQEANNSQKVRTVNIS